MKQLEGASLLQKWMYIIKNLEDMKAAARAVMHSLTQFMLSIVLKITRFFRSMWGPVKPCYFGSLPVDMQRVIVESLVQDVGPEALAGLQCLAQSCHSNRNLVEKYLLLHLVMRGEKEKVKARVNKNVISRRCLVMNAPGREWNGRFFSSISPFQYALWARDWDICNIMLDYIHHSEIIEQIESLEKNGTDYGQYCNFDSLLCVYDTHINKYNSWTLAERSEHWVDKVMPSQEEMPLHVTRQCQNTVGNKMAWIKLDQALSFFSKCPWENRTRTYSIFWARKLKNCQAQSYAEVVSKCRRRAGQDQCLEQS